MPTPVPFFRPAIGDAEVEEVVATLRSGWLTTGPRAARFETEFAAAVGAPHALALSSGTAALHLAVAAMGLARGQAVLVPTMTFAATAEVVRYLDAVPILVDCDPATGNLDPADALRKLADLRAGRLPAAIDPDAPVVGVMPVHVGGLMLDMDAVGELARRHGLWVVEDAAHAFPAAYRDAGGAWRRCGDGTSAVACFSFYANKTITTGEGGMATTGDAERDAAMRSLALHGLSSDAWGRYEAKGSWDYRILAPGYKYNLTDIAAAIGLHQLPRAEAMRRERQAIAERYTAALADVEEVELPPAPADRVHAWHLYPLRLRTDLLDGGREAFLTGLREHGVGFSVHWRPLHLHPYWADAWGWRPEHLPAATALWPRLVSLPIFPGMSDAEERAVVAAVRDLCRRRRRGR